MTVQSDLNSTSSRVGRAPGAAASVAAPFLSEAQLHKAAAQYLDAVLPSRVLWTTIGHGGGGKIRGAQLKAMGVKRGVPDIIICWDAGVYGHRVMWIELKSAKGRVKPEQDEFMRRAMSMDHFAYVCRSITDIEGAIKNHGVPTRLA